MVVAVAALVVAAGGSAVAATLITGANIKNESVTGADIKNGSLVPADFAASARRQLAGARGPQGPAGPTGATGPAGPTGAAGPAGADGVAGTARAFGVVHTDGTIDANLSRGLLSVTNPSPGHWCVTLVPFTPPPGFPSTLPAVVGPEWATSPDAAAVAFLNTGEPCAAGAIGVLTGRLTGAAANAPIVFVAANEAFSIVVP